MHDSRVTTRHVRATTRHTAFDVQSTNREDCERVKTGLENSTHAQRVLRTVHYDPNSNEIRDGIDVR